MTIYHHKRRGAWRAPFKKRDSQSNPRIWQRNYYESIIRNERHLNQIRQYIIDNPYKWAYDTEKPENDLQELLIDFIF